ncbi:hypothetical protein Fcan01_23852 [Folsomia candida]|uniref:Uncharacterized protein n=1 Tax=Folsomia candida TaxID=158441 RepID=A0A226D9S5_FOLCA|nr:hypothetical protein Fcan01_23852 [Folsomia candida]
MAAGIALTAAYFISFLCRLDLKRDPVLGQMLNFIKARKDSLSLRSLRREAITSTCLGILLDIIHIAVWLVPLIVAALTLLSPCFPPLITSLLCRPIKSKFVWMNGTFSKIGFAIVEFALCHMATTTANYYAIIFLVMATSRLWLDCKNLSDSVAATEDQIIFYRRIQIYEKTLNSCIRDRIFLTLALLGPLFQVWVGYALIQVANSGNIVILALCGVMYGAMFFMILFVFSVTGIVNRVSWYWIATRRMIGTKKVVRKTMKSLVPVRIQFGNNFVEPLTPLVVQEYCVRQTVSLLLLRG